jgi:hypothetical protein
MPAAIAAAPPSTSAFRSSPVNGSVPLGADPIWDALVEGAAVAETDLTLELPGDTPDAVVGVVVVWAALVECFSGFLWCRCFTVLAGEAPPGGVLVEVVVAGVTVVVAGVTVVVAGVAVGELIVPEGVMPPLAKA